MVIKTAWRISFWLPHEEPKTKCYSADNCKQLRSDRYKLTILKLQVEREDKEDSVQWAVKCVDCNILQLLPFKRFWFYWSKGIMALMHAGTSAV